jgi:hypothetical protein
MISTPATHITIRIVDPPRDPVAHASDRGLRVAVQNCGHWPVSATIDLDRLGSLRRAQRELEHVCRVAHRYYRRFPVDDDGLVLARLNARRDAAHWIAEQRAELIRLLIEPVGSC